MLTFLVFGFLAFLFAGAVALPFILLGLLFKLVFGLIFLPFKLIGGLFKFAFGLLLIPVILLFAVIAIVGAFVSALLSILAPLIPLALLLLFGWFIYKAATRPASPAI